MIRCRWCGETFSDWWEGDVWSVTAAQQVELHWARDCLGSRWRRCLRVWLYRLTCWGGSE